MNTMAIAAVGVLYAALPGCAGPEARQEASLSLSTVSTFAGSGTAGAQDGAGAAAQLNRPHGMAIAEDGTIYVSDRGSHRVRAIGSNGQVRTLAGSGQGYAEGAGAAAQFYDPIAIAVDKAGTLYVADRNNHLIRTVTLDGTVRTLAGTGAAGFANGPAASATFNQPYGVALDAAERALYVADYLNHAIRKIDLSTGAVTTLAGNGSAGNVDGVGANARFNQPYNVKMDRAGNLWVPDQLNHSIRKITPAGAVVTVAGNGKEGYADGPGTTAQFNNPTGLIAAADGSVIVADRNNHRIRRVAPDGTVSTLAGIGTAGFTDGAPTAAQFNRPIDVVQDRRTLYLYVSEENNHRVRRLQP
jgi:DNA-binding beta-propeller fold protein YncE